MDRAFLITIGQQPGQPGRAGKYNPEYCDLIKVLAQEGKFPETWCATMGIHRSTLYAWADVHPDFEEAVLQAWALLQHYWTEYAAQHLKDTNLRSTVLIRILASRFPRLYGRPEILEGTLEHFVARNAVNPTEEANAAPEDQQLAAGQREAIEARIAELQKRLNERKEP